MNKQKKFELKRYWVEFILDEIVIAAFWVTAPSVAGAAYEAQYELDARVAAEPEIVSEDWDSVNITNEVARNQYLERQEASNAN